MSRFLEESLEWWLEWTADQLAEARCGDEWELVRDVEAVLREVLRNHD